MNEQKSDATNLSMQIASFIRQEKLSSSDWLMLNRLMKQLKKQKCNVSRKVLRSVQDKFEKMQNKYQR